MSKIIFICELLLTITLAGCATNAPIATTAASGPYRGTHNVQMPTGVGNLFAWPVRGEVILPFGAKMGNIKNKGIDIKANEGASVRAAETGKVVYCDSYLKGFGKTIILDHGNNYQTVYSYNSEILVKVGDVVERNTVIARVGSTGRAKEPSLHFEVRKNGEPKDPVYYLRY